MGSAVAEMGLELDLCAARTVGGFVKEATSATMECGERERAARLEDSIKSLEGEKRKIEAFERELPLCMHLLSEVIKELKREIGRRCFGERFGHGFAEFLPIKSKFDEDRGAIVASDCKDKMNWMSSVQLWSDNYCENNDDDKKIDKMIFKEEDGGSHHREGEDNFFLECKSQIGGITFLPLRELSRFKEEKPTAPFPDLSLRSPAINPVLSISVVEDHSVGVRKAVGKATESSPVTVGAHLNLQPQQQPSRKSRRCWSQDLHRRFVVAIQRLGGAQLATPKQIRELMKVDGLTNDEVKSHLQKYRLHTRRVPNSSAAANRSIAAGGIWVSEEQNISSSRHSVSQSGSPVSPLQLASSARALTGDGSEEDGKLESYSWK